MKKFVTLTLAVLLTASLSGCAPKQGDTTAMTPEERTTLYQTAIENARDQESNDAFGVLTSADDPTAELIFQLLGVTAEDMSSFALSVSAMNVQAYGIAAIMPAAGKADDVTEGLNDYIDHQKEGFNQYLMDQYDIASNARLETLEDGTVLMVMAPDQDAIFDSIRDSIEGGK